MTTPTAKAAIALAKRGFAVFPLHTPDPKAPKGVNEQGEPTGGCSCRGRDCTSVGKHPRTVKGLHDATTDPEQVRKWWTMWPDANIGLATGREIPRGGYLAVLDIDPRNDGDSSLEALEQKHGALPATVMVHTGGGGWHHYFSSSEPVRTRKDLAPGVDLKALGGYVVAPPSVHATGVLYEWERVEALAVFAPLPEWLVQQEPKRAAAPVGDTIPKGQRNDTLASIAGSMRRRGSSEAAILAALRVENEERCDPRLPESDLERIAASIARYEPEPTLISHFPAAFSAPESVGDTASFASFAFFAPETPEPLAEPAFHGLAGTIVRTIEPHSEADPVALLGSFLVGFGNLCGPNAYLRVEGDRHYPRINATLVGETAKGRKGTSWGQVRRILRQVDPTWADAQIVEGLSSGEGLIHRVRNPVERDGVVIDPGVPDKRLMVTESELARPLKSIQRDGNTLSAVVRTAWDTGNAQTLTKNNPSKATGAHVSILGHITRDELLRDLTATEVANGFANRFLWLFVKRSKELPFGGDLQDDALAPLADQVRDAVEFAQSAGEIRWHPDTRPLWVRVYPGLSAGKPGMVGALLGRAEAQVVRLACVYALLDCETQIRPEHLRAALAVWQYVEDSVRYIFRSTSGNPTADEILALLKDAPDGVDRTAINAHFGRHKSANELGAAFELLHRDGLATVEKVPTGGRPREVWKVVPAKDANKAKEGVNTTLSAAEEVRNNREIRVA